MRKTSLLYYGLIIIFTNLFALNCHSQDLLDVKVEQRPFDYFKLFEPKKEHPIKSIIYLQNNLVRPDTITKEIFTKDGKKLKYFSFQKGKLSSITDYKYFPEQNAYLWEQRYFDKSKYFYTSKTIKNKAGKDLSFYNTTILNGDTISRQYANFNYNSEGLLVKREDGHDKLIALMRSYEYLGNDMVLAKTYTNPNSQDFYSAVAYQYNKEHLPIEKKAYLVRNGKADPALYSYYTYDNGLLIEEKYQGYDDKAKVTETTVNYQYNIKKQLIKLNASVDSIYKNIEYQYEGNKLKKVTIKTNTQIRLNREEFVYVDRTIETPFIFEKNFEYDEFGNLILIKELLNGQIYREFIKTISYF
ncbi:MAG: hypothetical protein EOP00_01485 [Pedobacter sp.]|nr:MAG: hypothetical protein EOP00_01485 [Pedobacter sp.]